ncbi:lantibiotic dehydratase [Nocardiopsis sp. NPDC006139]|uniref:lantibiotic dehydratase n=1 Tax=Nocardiopsis sp. NPDC006139 TaxID=3154578 RepID=UPI0033A9ABA9
MEPPPTMYTHGDAAAAVTDPVRPGPAVFRRAGLPSGVLDTLRFPSTGRAVDEILARRSAVAERGRSAADALHPVIGALPEREPLRPRLVGLRRALYRGRRPTAKEWAPDLADRLPAGPARDIRRWLADLDGLRSAEASLERVLDAEAAERRDLLVGTAADPAFRIGLDVSSPALAAELDKWLGDPARSPRPRTVSTLARYVARAAAKTSPLSAFLTSGPVEWAADGPAVAVHPRQALGVHEPAEHGLRERIAELAASRPDLRDEAVLRLNPTAERDGGTIGYIGPTASQAPCSIPARPAVLDVVALLGAEAAGLSRRELRRRLCGGGAEPAERVDAFIDHLLKAGLLVRVVPVSRFETMLGDCAAWLDDRHPADPGARALADDLRELDRTLSTRVPPDRVEPYREHRRRVIGQVRGLAAHAPASDPLGAYLATRTINGLRDSAVTPGPLASCSVPAWEPVLDDLDALRRWLAPFALWLPARLVLTELLGEAVAARGTMPLVRFYRELQKARKATGDIYRELNAWLASPTAMSARESAWESVRRLAGVCDAATAAIAPYPVSGPVPAPTGAPAWPEPVVIGTERLRTAAAGFPAWVPPVRSLDAAVQVVPGDGPGPAVVVNTVMPGFGAVRARIDHLTDPGRLQAPPRFPDLPGGPVYACFSDRFGLSLNDHRQVLPYTLGDAPMRVPGDRDTTLAVEDLLVRVEEETGLLALWSRRHRRPVRVVHTGMMVSLWQYPFSHLLSILSGEVLTPAPAPPVTAAAGLRRDRPRLTAGGLTLVRGARRFPVSEVPVIRPGERSGQYLLRLEEWRRTERLPQRCFLTLWRTSEEGPRPASTKWRKPMYLDFGSWFLVQGLVGVLQRPDAGAVVFTEALPDPLAPGSGPDPHVAELVLGVSGDGRP